MLVFDQLKKNDPQLRLLAVVIAAGMLVLLAGLWWMQIVSAREYQASLETQSYRTVRISAVRGNILDRNGSALAENKPTYNVSLYLEDLRDQYKAEYTRVRPRRVVTNSLPFWKEWLGFTAVQTQSIRLSKDQINELQFQVQCKVVSNSLLNVGQRLQSQTRFDADHFKRHCKMSLPMPYPVARNISPVQVARFEEQSANPAGMDLEIQSTRVYPHQTTAAHLLGYLQSNPDSLEGEEAFFSYRMPDYSGLLGIERAYDRALHGRAGGKSVVVNSLGYRQSEIVWKPAEPGWNVVLTIDLRIQQATERALQEAPIMSPRGAAVVMDVNTGDVLAIASVPTYNPNYFVDRQSYPPDYYTKMQASGAEHNRATGENYAPGSIIKTLAALAFLENGLDPNWTCEVSPDPRDREHGAIKIQRNRYIGDTVRPGTFNLKRALMESCNTFFITNGLRFGIEKYVQLGHQLHLGESMGLSNRQETAGIFPSQKQIRSGWSDGETANLCIGQGYIAVSPLQMTVMACALANNGKVFQPRLVDRIEPQDPLSGSAPIVFPKGIVRDRLDVKPRNLQIVRDALDAEVHEGGTGHRAIIPGFRICGKTGTAEVQNERGQNVDKTVWFLSFAPYERPRYAVVVMIESGVSGGVTCAPVAKRIYEALLEIERTNAAKTGTLSKN